MLRFNKIWGWTSPLLVTPLIEIHRAHIEPGFKCSMHRHEYKWNAFYCIKGKLVVSVRKNDYDLVDETVLFQDDMTVVPPNELHYMSAGDIAGAEILEIYYLSPIDPKDIVRTVCGGAKL